MKKCRMMSIDASTKKSAFAIYDNGIYKTSKLIDCEKEKGMDQRFFCMSKNLWDSLEIYKPDIIYIEEMVVSKNVHTQRFLTRLQGVIYAYTLSNDCEFNTIRPTTWRKLVGIEQGKKKREELKLEAINMVKEEMDIMVNDDEAEAILIGKAAINLFSDIEKRAK